MRINEIYDLLKEKGIRPMRANFKIDNLTIMRCRSSDEEKTVKAEIRRKQASALISHFASDVMGDADWNELQTPDGLEIRVQAYMLTPLQINDLLRAAYTKGRLHSPTLEFK